MPLNPTPTKRNPWPVAIIAYFALFIAFIVGFTVYAIKQRTDLVGSDYYDQEVRFQQQLDRLNRTEGVRQQVSITYDAGQHSVLVALPATQAREQISGRIQFYRPSDAALDQNLELTFNPDGSHRVDARRLQPGLWKIRVQWTIAGQQYFFEQALVIG